MAKPRDVDVESCFCVDPSCIDDIVSLSFDALSGPRVDVEQEFAVEGCFVAGVFDFRVVVVVGEVD